MSHVKKATKAVVCLLIWAGDRSWQTELQHRKLAANNSLIT